MPSADLDGPLTMEMAINLDGYIRNRTVTFEDSDKTLVIDITSDLADGETLTIADLATTRSRIASYARDAGDADVVLFQHVAPGDGAP